MRRTNLEELQAEMRARNQRAVIPNNTDVNSLMPTGGISNIQNPSSINIPPPLCAHCHHRVCRKGSILCSRCTGTGIQEELRDTLPGMEIKRDVIPPRTSISVDQGVPMPEDRTFYPREQQAESTNNVIFPTSQILQDTTYYTRKEVAQMLGVSSTSISRWEHKGKTPLPLKIARTGQLLYSEELVAKLREFVSTIVIVQHQPRPDTPQNQQHDAAKIVAKKTFKLNRGIEKAVALRLGRDGLGGKLI